MTFIVSGNNNYTCTIKKFNNPTIANVTIQGGVSAMFTGLNPNTEYYITCVSINNKNIPVQDPWRFITSDVGM